MKKSFSFLLGTMIYFIAVSFLAVPTFALAAQCDDNQDNDSDGKIDFEGFGAIPKDSDCSSPSDDSEASATGGGTTTVDDAGVTDLSFAIENPLESDIDTLPEFLNRLVEIFLMIGTPIIALAIIYSGFLFVIARGNPEAIEKAKATLGYTLLGAAILLGAFVISTAIQDTIMTISDESTE